MKRVFCAAAIALLAVPAFAAVGDSPRDNLKAAIVEIDAAGIPWEQFGQDLCRHEGFCAIEVGPLQVHAVGKTVEVLPSSQVAPEDALLLCSSILAGLSYRSPDSTMVSVSQAYLKAAITGSHQEDFGRIRWSVSMDGNDVGCEVVVRNI